MFTSKVNVLNDLQLVNPWQALKVFVTTYCNSCDPNDRLYDNV